MALRLVAELGGDGSGFERMLNKAGVSAKRFSSSAIAPLKNVIAGAFTVGAISSLTKSTIDWASKLRDVSDELGVNVEWLQKMQNGAKLVGADIEDIAKFIGEMNKARQEALANPAGKDAQAFKRLGVTPADEKNLSTQALFDKIVKAFKNGANVQLTNDVQEVGGQSARNLISAFATQFENDTPILSEVLIDQLDDVGDRFTVLATVLKVGLAPAIAAVADALAKMFDNLMPRLAFLKNALEYFYSPKNLKQDLAPVPGGLKSAAKGIATLNPGEAASGLTTVFDAVLKHFQDALLTGGVAGMKKEASLDAMMKEIDAALEKGRAARKARENSPPQFDPLAITPTAPRTPADSLVKVGNFLGQAPGAVNSIAEKQLTIANQQLDKINEMTGYLKALAEPNRSSSSTINVPPT